MQAIPTFYLNAFTKIVSENYKIKIVLILLNISFYLTRNHHLYYHIPLYIGQLKCKLRLFFLMNILQRWIKLMNNWLMVKNDMWVLMALLDKSISGTGSRKRNKWLYNYKMFHGLHSSRHLLRGISYTGLFLGSIGAHIIILCASFSSQPSILSSWNLVK